jgi:hypothetical protein
MSTTQPLPLTQAEIDNELAELDQLEQDVKEIRSHYQEEVEAMSGAINEALTEAEAEAAALEKEADDFVASMNSQAETIATDAARQQVAEA